MHSPSIERAMRRALPSGRKSFRPPSGWGKAFSPSKQPSPYWVV